jgi:CheY-like chemotaxis protein
LIFAGQDEFPMLDPKTVLCIDDEPIGLMVRKLVLESAGYHVLTAPDGPHGLTLFESCPVDAVILDYYMPGMDGGQVAARMRQMNPSVPILLLSAYIDLPSDVFHLVDAYITKGQGPQVLLEELQALVFSLRRGARNAA